ncbi:VOC family protein [Amycolatopsis sp. CA-230715]|uniref:VOC family protein n=1 Tax=Amycolatopsis sp. CA-230715 TaxID=2745196 RepID=UPI001C020F27|nr:VOC family protein [Amycolatopsis sp. CA-230715]QWF82962.1 Putative glyoxylase CFP32 [Amycolatopsis sp. CA-230715]
MSVMSPRTVSVLPAGLPCWVELASRNETAAEHFYGGLFGWKYQVNRDPATPTGRYSIASLDGISVGGLYRAGSSQPPGWILHLSVRNIVTAAEWVEHLGGRTTLGPIDIPDRGSILHALDPSGAPVVFWQPPDSWEFGTDMPATFTGADLNTHDGNSADHFFCRLFGYTAQQIGDAHSIDYAEWRLDHESVLYRYVMGPEYRADTPPHWMVYFEVSPARGTDATAGHAIMLGGTVVIQPYDTPWGRIAVLADPDGAVFSIIDHSQVVEGYGRAEVDDPYVD